MFEEDNQPVIIQVTPELHQTAHEHARQYGWASTSAWLRHLLMSWNGQGLRPRRRKAKQLAVRLDEAHRNRLQLLAKRSKTSESEAFAMLVQRTLSDRQIAAAAPTPAQPPRERPPPRNAYAAWAAAIINAAHATPHKFGEQKAYIAGVADELIARYEPDDPALFRQQLDGILLDLNRRDLIRLVRADLIPVMDFDLVERSELTHMKATFHFVLLDQNRR